MSEANVQTKENCAASVIGVTSTTDLPYKYIPYDSVERARVNHPCDTLYVFEARSPKGYKIVAYPVVMRKPKNDEEEDADAILS